MPPRTWNSETRLGLVLAMVHEGRLTIDSFHDRPQTYTNDKAFYKGHYYCDKPVGTALLGAAAYGPLYGVFRWMGREPSPALARWWVTLWTCAIPAAVVAGWLLLWLEPRIGGAPATTVVLLAWLATPIAPLGELLYGHSLAAACLMGAWLLLSNETRQGSVLAGGLLGLAVLAEPQSAMPAAFLWALMPGPRWPAVLSGAIALLPQLAYNALCFDQPLANAYHYIVLDDYRTAMQQGVSGVSFPRADVLFWLTLHPLRGIFLHSPLLLMAIWGWIHQRQFVVPAAFAALLLVNAGYFAWWGGGVPVARHVASILPLLAVGLAYRPARGDLLYRTFAIVSLLQMSMLILWPVAPDPLKTGDTPPWTSPIWDHALPQLIGGAIHDNLGHWLGLEGWLTLLPLVAVTSTLLYALYRTDRA